MTDAREKYEQSLKVFSGPPSSSGKQLLAAICLTKLGDYPEAQKAYSTSLRSALVDRLWHLSGEINELVDTLVLSNDSSLLPRVLDEVEAYKLDRRGDALYPLYAYAITCLLVGEDDRANDHVVGLLNKPKIKDTFATGLTIRAIVERDQSAFEAALDGLLRAHRGRAKFGGLRETPEGYLCLPAMALSKLALDRGMQVELDNEYLSRGYLDHLLSR